MYYSHDSRGVGYLEFNNNGNTVIGIDDGDQRFDGVPLMQFIGILDKNGKEIWEGDLVKWDGDPDTDNEFYRTPNGIYEVAWRWTGFHFLDYQNCKFVPKRGEVIGNIYENPELTTNLNA